MLLPNFASYPTGILNEGSFLTMLRSYCTSQPNGSTAPKHHEYDCDTPWLSIPSPKNPAGPLFGKWHYPETFALRMPTSPMSKWTELPAPPLPNGRRRSLFSRHMLPPMMGTAKSLTTVSLILLRQYSANKLAGIKYLMHRVTYKAYYGTIRDLDCSHTLYLGVRTSRYGAQSRPRCVLSLAHRNVNPLHLAHEDNETNRGRNCCHLFFERMLSEWVRGTLLIDDRWEVEDIVRWLWNINCACKDLHGDLYCDVDVAHWLADRAGLKLGQL